MCRHVMPIAGTSAIAFNQTKRRNTPSAASNTASSSQASRNTHSSNASSQSSGGRSIESDNHAKKALAKSVEAKDEKQRLLAAMLKASTKQVPAKKTTMILAGGSPKKESVATPNAKTPKKSLFSFLNSL